MQAEMEDYKGGQASANARHMVGRIKLFYQRFSLESLAKLDELYTPDIEFRDPVHVLNGSLAVKNYLRSLATGLTHYRIHYLDEVYSDNAASLMWEMEYAHPGIKGGQVLRIRGATFVRFTNRIYYHEDCYDLGAMVYEQLPILGRLVRAVKQRLAGKR
jgi:hypothetical protein